MLMSNPTGFTATFANYLSGGLLKNAAVPEQPVLHSSNVQMIKNLKVYPSSKELNLPNLYISVKDSNTLLSVELLSAKYKTIIFLL